MRLRRIEAVRFGRLTEVPLGPLGNGLTVVLGPNEAGKSSFTALVRYVLYGFPTEKSASERPYLSDAGNREGRLVFESPDGEWVVERAAGVRGGPVSVRTVRGVDRPGLLGDLTGGVSEQAFKVVFGFGLAEMAEIERLRGSEDDIISRLYAAGAGLGVSPQEVRSAIEAEAAELYRPRGSKPVINALIGRARELRSSIAELERDATALAAEAERLDELAGRRDAARIELDRAVAHHRRLAEEARVLGELEEDIRRWEQELVTSRREAREARERAAAIVVDTAVLDNAASIETLAGDLSGFRAALAEARDAESRLATLDVDYAAALEEARVEDPDAADITADTRTGAERWSARLAGSEQAARIAAEARDRAADEAQAARIEVPVAGAETARPSVGDGLAWVLVGVTGVALAAAGFLGDQWVVLAAGVVLAVVAGGMLVWRRAGAPSSRSSRDAASGAERAADLARRAEQARLAAERATAEESSARTEWDLWLRERGLPAGLEPAAAVRTLESVSRARRLAAERAEVDRRLTRQREDATGFVERLATVAAALGVSPPEGFDEAPAVLARLKERLDTAREARVSAEQASAAAESASGAVADTEARQAQAIARAQEIIERLGVEGGLVELAALVERADIAVSEAQDEWGALKSEHAALEARIGERERTDAMGGARLELVGVRERIAGHAERYAVLSVAARLLREAQERYERERQPAVVKEAARIFATITGGSYPHLNVPLDADAIEVFDASARAKDTARLSTGTAEQLYLALRLALIAQLEERGTSLPVLMDDVFANFDPERKRGAAAAVAELAAHRQIVLFTCHPETAALLAETDPGLTELTLDRC